ncbi:MAG: hypothetical protein ABSD56_09375 [Bryobacteraceae bacterium]
MRTIRFVLIVVACVFAAPSSSAYSVNGNVTVSVGCAPEGARVEVFDVNMLPGGILKTRILGTSEVDPAGHFTVTFPWVTVVGPPTPPNYESGGPDVIVRITQKVDGTTVTALDEAPSAARWNLADGSTLSLTVSGMGVCHGPASSAPHNQDFVFTRIGRIPVADIDCRGDLASSGYAYKSGTTPINGDYTNQPFGGTMDVFGFFGSLSGVNRYKFEYSADGGATYVELSAPLWDYYYEATTHTWISAAMGPVSEGGQNNLYKLPYVEKPTSAWAWFNRLAVFDTLKVPDGNVRFRVRGYYWNGTTLTLSGALHIDPAFGAIRLEIDNTAPAYRINSVLRNGVLLAECAFVTLGTSDTLEVRFTAQDPLGHLGQYALSAMYGHNHSVSPPPSAPDKAVDGYSNHVSGALTWTGNPQYRVQYTGYSVSAMPTCAYQMRLSVSKRTTNGYDLIFHDLEDTWHIAIQR